MRRLFGAVFFRRTLKVATYSSLTAVVGSSWYFLHKNDYDLSSIGAMRLGRAGFAASLIVFDYKWSLRGLNLDSESYKFEKSLVHKRSAERLLKLACANGGVWIKVGQHCASLEYLLPVEYTSTFSVLHSNAPESPFSDICKVVREELQCNNISEKFEEFTDRPIGAASLAQVYKAKLKENGKIVAVKVQHRRVKPHSNVDIVTMEVLVKTVAKIFPEFKLIWLAEEMKKNLPTELDFVNEGHNVDRIRRMFGHLAYLKVPEVYWDYTTDRCLTMEYCEGGKVNDLAYMETNGIKRDEVCRKLGQLYSEMIFIQGCVHCDPHPGNVLVQNDPSKGLQLVLLDHGLYVTLRDDFRLNYANLWLAILSADKDRIVYWANAMGVGNLYGLFACMLTARSWKSVTSGIDKQKATDEENEEIKAYVGSLLSQISDVLDRVPRPMLLIFKTNDLLRGIEYKLKMQGNAYSFIQMSKYCVTAVHNYAYKQCTNWRCKLRVIFSALWAHSRIYLYEKYVQVCSAVGVIGN